MKPKKKGINDKRIRDKDRETKCANFYISNWITSTWLVILTNGRQCAKYWISIKWKFICNTYQRLYLLLFIINDLIAVYGFRCFNIFLEVSTRFRIFDNTKESQSVVQMLIPDNWWVFIEAQSFMSFRSNSWNGQNIVFDSRRQIISTSILISDENNLTEGDIKKNTIQNNITLTDKNAFTFLLENSLLNNVCV